MVITGRTRNAVVRKGSWVRIPPPPPQQISPNRDVAQLGSALRSGHGTIQFIKYPPNSHKPFNTAIYGDLKNKIHVVKSVLTTCYPTDTGDIEK